MNGLKLHARLGSILHVWCSMVAGHDRDQLKGNEPIVPRGSVSLEFMEGFEYLSKVWLTKNATL